MTAFSGTMPLPPALRALVALGDAAREASSALLGLATHAGSLLLRHRALRRIYLGPLWQRSRVLRGASIALQALRAAPRVAGGAAAGPVPELYSLEVTLKPSLRTRGLQRWRPEDITLVAPGALAGRPEQDEPVGRLLGVEVWRHGAFQPVEGPLFGPQRLRLRVAFRPGTRQFHFRYYLELLQRAPAGD